MSPTGTVLHLAPHPDDELIGAPATLFALRDAGWQVVNLACSLGAPDERDRRRAELVDACSRAGYELVVVPDPVGDPLEETAVAGAQAVLGSAIAEMVRRYEPVVVVAPSPHDRHRGHEVVGRAAVEVLGRDEGARLWFWGLWGDLPFPTLAVGFDDRRLAEILVALEAHGGELARNDYRRVVKGRAEMNASLGPERVFGFGSAGAPSGAPYVEVLTEVVRSSGGWMLGRPRWLDAGDALARPGTRDIGAWLDSPSLTTRYGPPPST